MGTQCTSTPSTIFTILPTSYGTIPASPKLSLCRVVNGLGPDVQIDMDVDHSPDGKMSLYPIIDQDDRGHIPCYLCVIFHSRGRGSARPVDLKEWFPAFSRRCCRDRPLRLFDNGVLGMVLSCEEHRTGCRMPKLSTGTWKMRYKLFKSHGICL
jgi:hypothetical protein